MLAHHVVAEALPDSVLVVATGGKLQGGRKNVYVDTMGHELSSGLLDCSGAGQG